MKNLRKATKGRAGRARLQESYSLNAGRDIPDFESIYRSLAAGGVANIGFTGTDLSLHRILLQASKHPWLASISHRGQSITLTLRKVGSHFAFDDGMAHGDGCLVFPVANLGLYLINLHYPVRVAFRLRIKEGRPLAISYHGGQFAFSSHEADETYIVVTEPAMFSPGGYPITIQADRPETCIMTVDLLTSIPNPEDPPFTLPPDQFTRFRAAAAAAIVINGKAARFLDVGAGDGALSCFLPDLISFDRQFLDRHNHIIGSILEDEIPECDVALMLDVLEHIPNPERSHALDRLAQAAQKGVVICAPFNSPNRVMTEKYVAANFRRFSGYEHQFLEEHRLNGLPDLKETLATLDRLRLHTVFFGFHPLNTWAFSMVISSFLDRDPQFQPLREIFFRFINQNFTINAPRMEDCYETLIIATRAPLAKNIVRSLRQKLAADLRHRKSLPPETLPLILDTLVQGKLIEKDEYIHYLESEKAAAYASHVPLEDRIKDLTADRDNWRKSSHETETDRLNKIDHIRNIELHLMEAQNRIGDLEADHENRIALEKDLQQRIASLTGSLENTVVRHEELTQHLHNLEEELLRAQCELDSLRADQGNRIKQAEEEKRIRTELEIDRTNWHTLFMETESNRKSVDVHARNLEHDLLEARFRLQAQETQTKEMIRRIEDQESVITHAMSRTHELEEHAQNLTGELVRTQAASESLQKDQINRIQQEQFQIEQMKSVELDRDNWKQLWGKSESYRNNLQEHNTNIERDLADAKARLVSQEDSVRHLIERQGELTDHAQNLTAELTHASAELQALRSDHSNRIQLEKQLNNLLSSVEADRDNWKILWDQSEAHRNELKRHVSNLESRNLQSIADQEELRNINEALRLTLQQKEEEFHIRRQELEESLKTLQIKNGETEREQMDVRIRMETLQREMAHELEESNILRRESEDAIRRRDVELDGKQKHIDNIESLLHDIWSSRTWSLLRGIDRLLGRAPGKGKSPSGSADSDDPSGSRQPSSTHQRGLRILQTVHFFLPRHYAGVELYTYYLSKQLQLRNEVHLFFAEHNLTVPQYTVVDGEYDGIPYREVTNNFHYNSFVETYENAAINRIFEGIIDAYRPDVIHFEHLLNLSLGMIEVAKKHGIPTVYTLHDFWLTCPSGGQRFRKDLSRCENVDVAACSDCFLTSPFNAGRLERKTFEVAQKLGPAAAGGIYKVMNAMRIHTPSIAAKATSSSADSPSLASQIADRLVRVRKITADVDLFLAPSQFIADVFADFGVPRDHIKHLPYGREAFPVHPRERNGTLRIGFVGTLAPHKGVHVLIEACRLLPAGRVNIKIFGELTIAPDYVKSIRAQAEGLPIIFMGKADNTQIADVFAQIDVLVVPSIWWENSPFTIYEASIAHVAIIGSAIGGIPELVRPGQNGLLFTAGDHFDLAEKLRLLLDNCDMLIRLQQGAPPIKTIQENAIEHEAIYHSLITAHQR